MKTKVAVIALVVLALLSVAVAVGYMAYGRAYCGGGVRSCHRGGGDLEDTASVAHPTWVDASVEGNAVSIPVSLVETNKIVNFRVPYQGTSMTFMAYQIG